MPTTFEDEKKNYVCIFVIFAVSLCEDEFVGNNKSEISLFTDFSMHQVFSYEKQDKELVRTNQNTINNILL